MFREGIVIAVNCTGRRGAKWLLPDADKRKLAEQDLNGLIIYAEEHAQEMWPPLFHIRKSGGEINAYWDLEKDWQRNFNSRLMLSYYDQKAEEISDERH